jgi:hypothetical protein
MAALNSKKGMDQVMSEGGDQVANGVVGHNENQHVMKLRHQLEFYLGDANLSKDRFLMRKLEHSTQIELTTFLEFNRIKGILSAALVESGEEQTRLL